MSELSDKELSLHRALIAGDVAASAKLAELLLPEITKYLGMKFRDEHDHDRVEAATDALMDYLDNPERFDPDRAKLGTYLRFNAARDMENIRAKTARRLGRIEIVDPVELPESGGNNEEDDPVLQELMNSADQDELNHLLQRTFEREVDRGIAGLILDGVRETAEYSEVIGISHLSVDEQRCQVKKHKDRVKARLKRAAHAKG